MCCGSLVLGSNPHISSVNIRQFTNVFPTRQTAVHFFGQHTMFLILLFCRSEDWKTYLAGITVIRVTDAGYLASMLVWVVDSKFENFSISSKTLYLRYS